MTQPNNLRVIREPERLRKTGVSRTSWWRLERDGLAPKSFPIGNYSRGWLEHELDAWIAARAAERDASSEEAA
jgi:prophage regulatory protein